MVQNPGGKVVFLRGVPWNPRGALTYGSDGDVRTRPQKQGSFGDRLNKEKRGSFSEDKRKIGGHLVRTIKKEGVF